MESASSLRVNLKKVNSGTKVLNIVLVMTFFVSPLVLVVVKYFKTNEWKLLLPFLITYPFDPYDIRYWPFVYIHQIWSVNNIDYISISTLLNYDPCITIQLGINAVRTRFRCGDIRYQRHVQKGLAKRLNVQCWCYAVPYHYIYFLLQYHSKKKTHETQVAHRNKIHDIDTKQKPRTQLFHVAGVLGKRGKSV
ncbi:unnamed protein product [Leptidea sinapis]|uniref:Uncharacterized protein n=1 Tax=Leptidea sinapis TaxID=189913 RepID=A0A5E4PLR2_9NEOP|nr:unnamed protein product [Leptidea sinapis]